MSKVSFIITQKALEMVRRRFFLGEINDDEWKHWVCDIGVEKMTELFEKGSLEFKFYKWSNKQ